MMDQDVADVRVHLRDDLFADFYPDETCLIVSKDGVALALDKAGVMLLRNGIEAAEKHRIARIVSGWKLPEEGGD